MDYEKEWHSKGCTYTVARLHEQVQDWWEKRNQWFQTSSKGMKIAASGHIKLSASLRSPQSAFLGLLYNKCDDKDGIYIYIVMSSIPCMEKLFPCMEPCSKQKTKPLYLFTLSLFPTYCIHGHLLTAD
jgi:hypothetical protein